MVNVNRMKRRHALLLGRFQPPTIAHLSTVETILNGWKFLTIAIVHDSPRPAWFNPKWDEYLRKTQETSYAPGKNPFTAEEVKKMWDACLAAQGLHQQVQSAVTVRPYFDREFSRKYPPQKIDLVRAALESGDTMAYTLRSQIFFELLQREIHYVRPPFELHNTEIKELIRSGGRTWKEFIPAGAYEVFLRIGGPRRMGTKSNV